jgi:hypothetical protein
MLDSMSLPVSDDAPCSGQAGHADPHLHVRRGLYSKLAAQTLLEYFVGTHGGLVFVDTLRGLYDGNPCLLQFQGTLRQLVASCSALHYVPRNSSSNAMIYCDGSLVLGPKLEDFDKQDSRCSLHSKCRTFPKKRVSRKMLVFASPASDARAHASSSRTHKTFATVLASHKTGINCQPQLGKWKAAVQTSIDASRQVNRKWLQQSGLHRAIALWSVAGIARDTPEAYVTLSFCILCQLLDIHCATNFTCYLLSAAIYAIILPGQSWCLAAATALVFPVAGKVGASKLPGPEVRKQGKKDGTEANVRWRIQSIAMIKENTVLFQSHGMPPDANTHTLETEKMDTSSAEALQRRMVTILEGHTCRDDKYKQCYAIIQPHLSNPSELPEIVLH